ncbi:alpha/beta fold hydrolase [Williamsia maris]|uniref:Pimeloyl-ACP methyl ester carboxylesterase n=1 Tax=Williamsia maris TaxID=72806 RepID=A0ABT1H870_9NOCA|nr:alpha/beta hydrolase [Williamsia maris]MCP2174456.1 Pimeloyl-ACP methyl ester carboxylesterase [Williamsia maris]
MHVGNRDRRSVELSAGLLEYAEAGDPHGPPVVLLHGLLMNDAQWDLVLPRLPESCRYVLPVLPLGGHRVPMSPHADLTLAAMVDLLAEFLDALDLRDVTLVVTDWGGPLFLTARGRDERVGRMIVLPCEAYDNFPPGLAGKMVAVAVHTPGGIRFAAWQLRIPFLRRMRLLLGDMAVREIPQDIVERWTAGALASAGVRSDVRRYALTRFDRQALIADTEKLACFDRPALIIWAPENRMMPAAHGPALAELLPDARLVEIEDSYVLTMLDRPDRTAEVMSEFLRAELSLPR